jgi:hypothetical protein
MALNPKGDRETRLDRRWARRDIPSRYATAAPALAEPHFPAAPPPSHNLGIPYIDVHVPQGITDALRTRGIQVLTAQDDHHAKADDPVVLERATALGRVLFTRDRDFLQIGAAWQQEAKAFSGVIYAHQLRVTIGRCVQDLALMAEAANPADLANQIEHLPL